MSDARDRTDDGATTPEPGAHEAGVTGGAVAAGGRRKGRPRAKHTIAMVVVTTAVVLGMISALTVVFEYRHLNGNLNVQDLTNEIIAPRPSVHRVAGEKQPINMLLMGSDSRDCKGCNIDNLTNEGQRSDTTIFVHLSADRQHAYGVSIPRDSIVDRPQCKGPDGGTLPAATGEMWNAAFSIGGPACTIAQFEQLTNIKIDHFVVVNFEGFRDMVDAVGGVEVCIPQTIDDRAHGIYLPAGTRKLEGQQALNYVRERYAVSGGSDIFRIKRQQAFLASMIHAVFSANTLANPVRLLNFLNAATKSLTLDPDLGSVAKIARLGYEFRDIGLGNIQFLTVPNGPDPADPNHVVWLPKAANVFARLRNDKPLGSFATNGSISAEAPPGVSTSPSPGSKPSGKGPSDGSTSSPSSPSATPSPEDKQALIDAGLCA